MAQLDCNNTGENSNKDSSTLKTKATLPQKKYKGFVSLANNFFGEIYICSFDYLRKLFGKIVNKAVFFFKKKEVSNISMKTKDSLKRVIEGYKKFGNSINPKNMDIKKRILIYTISSFAIVSIAVSANFISTHTIALSVRYDGEEIGYVSDENILADTLSTIQDNIVYKDNVMQNIPVSSIKTGLVNKNEVMSDDELSDKILSLSNHLVKDGYGLYINNKFYGATLSKEYILSSIEDLIRQYNPNLNDEAVEVSFLENLKIKEGLYLNQNIISSYDMRELLVENSTKNLDQTLKIKDINLSNKENGDSIINDSSDDKILNVVITQSEVSDQNIPFETIESLDNNYLKGHVEVVSPGENGINQVSSRVSYLNGVEISRYDTSIVNTKFPTNKVLLRGNKEPTNSTNLGKVPSSGFIWPLSGGYISDTFRSRGGRHAGLDIAAPYGSSIYAVASGKVISAGWYGGYGNYITIDHGNGLQTSYAHSSKILVSVGKYVNQGDIIALVGSTGQSTGNHLHLEFNLNGRNVDPAIYVGRR